MKKTITLFSAFFLLILSTNAQNTNTGNAQNKSGEKAAQVAMTLIRNLNVGYGAYNTSTYKSSNFHVGTSYSQYFKKDPKAYWQLGVGMNWYDYTLKKDNSKFSVNSVSVPFRLGYVLYSNDFFGIRIFAGPTYEYVYHSNYSDAANSVQRSQLALSAGGIFSISGVTSLHVSYKFYPTGLFSNGDFQRSAFNFSIGF